MKKLILFVLALMLVCVSAFAETALSPQEFLSSRGLLVIDQDTLDSMGDGKTDMSEFEGWTLLFFSAGSEESAPAIGVFDGEMFYFAIDMEAMFNGGPYDAKAMGQIYIEMCDAYPDFDVYAYGEDDDETAYMYSKIDLSKVVEVELIKARDSFPTMDEYIAAVEAELSK